MHFKHHSDLIVEETAKIRHGSKGHVFYGDEVAWKYELTCKVSRSDLSFYYV
jgi:hypothetical protein